MSDIFDFNGDYNNPSQNNEHTQSRNEYWAKKNERRAQLNAEYQEDLERYSVNISQEDYNIIKDAIANAEVPEDEAYRWACAMELNKQYDMPVAYAYQNLEQINAAKWGDRFTFTPKTNFKAIVDSGRLGANTLKMGRLGSKIMKAQMFGKTEYNNYLAGKVESLDDMMAQYEALEQESAQLTDLEDRNLAIEALKFAAQSAPYTGYVAGVGLLGGLLSGGAGTAAAFAVSMDNAAGLEYMRLRKAGSDVGDAVGFAILSGGLQALVETSLGNVAGALGKSSLGDLASQAVKNKITGNVFKRLAYNGTFKDLALRMGKEWLKENAEEGLEEVVQDLIEKGTDALAAELGGYEIEGLDAKTVARDAWENFRGGVMGSLILGLGPSVIKQKHDIKEFINVRNLAEVTPSLETFNKITEDSTLWEGMSDEEKKNAQKTTWENAQARVEAASTAEAQKIAEGRDAAEGAEEGPVENEDGTTEANPVARDERGRLYTSDDVSTDDAGNVTGGTFVVGDKTKSKNNRYGYIKYSQDAEGNITIDNFKMTEGRDKLRAEAFDEFARQHPDVNIEWNATAPDLQDFKNELIDANPSGKKNGLNYYSTTELDNVATRKRVADELRKNIHNVKRNTDGSYTQTELSNKQIAAGVTLIESAARRMGMGLNEYINKTFGNQIFGSREEFASASLAQGEDVNKKAGGMYQGVAQANWREVGQQIKAVIYAGEHADFSTWAHEMAHVFQNQLDGQLKADAEAAFNVQGGDWINSTYTFKDGRTLSSAEAFAYGFQDWLETGKAENEQMRNIFQKFAEFIADCYNRLKSHLDFTPEIESVFNQLLDGDDTIMSKALKAAQEQDNEYRASLKRQAEEKQAAKEAAAEQAKKQAEAAREEASEGTEFTEAVPTAEELLNGIEEVENETKETTEETNAIDNALENTNLTDEQKEQIAETLKDESSTVVEKAEATTEVAESAYDDIDLFQDEGGQKLLSQLAGEPSIRRMAESEERERILTELDAAQLLDEKYKNMDANSRAARIRRATGWEKDASGQWKYELDDSVNRIKTEFFKNNPGVLSGIPYLLNLGDILEAKELYKVFPYMKNVRVSFYSDPNAFRAVLTPQGIKVNTRYLQGMNGETGLKGVLAHEIQHIIQAMEFAESKGLQGADIEQLYNDVMKAMQAAGERKYDYDTTSLQKGLDAYMKDAGEIEARNVARRILMNADQRRMNTLASTEDVKRPEILFQAVKIDPAELTEAEQQIEYIKEQYEGTDEWMKAPNGEPTNLNEKQWLQVRTQNFKRWFGNWELEKKEFNIVGTEQADFNNKADAMTWAEKNIVGLMTNEETGGKGEINISNKSVDEMLNLNQRGKSSSNEVHYAALTKLKEIIHDSEIVDAHPDFNKDENGKRTPLAGINKDVNIDVLYGALRFNGDIYRVKTTIKRFIDKNSKAKAYAYDVQKIEVLPGIADNSNNATVSKGSTSITGDILLRGVRKVNQKIGGDGELALDDYSKVLDENGEPLVVYHGTDADFTVFDASKSRANMDIQGNFFSPWDIDAQGYGPNVRAFYLNIRNPANSSQGYSALNTYKGQNEAGIKARELLKSKGYDGVNNDNEEYITFEPNQIKSATDNNGNFDANNPDILFQIAGEIGAENLDNSEVQEGVSRMENLAIAKQMEAAGEDAQKIRLATGWEKGSDGKWKYEIDDSKVKVDFYAGMKVWENEHPDFIQLRNRILKGEELSEAENERFQKLYSEFDAEQEKRKNGEFFKLEEVLDFPELYKAYPTFKNIDVYIGNGDKKGVQGEYESDLNTISLYKEGYEDSPIDWTIQAKSVLLHEIQHAIQYIEGFAKGGSDEQFEVISVDKLEQEIESLQKIANGEKKSRLYSQGDAHHKIEELQARIEEINENALEGQVEVDGNVYANEFEAYRALAGEVEARNVQTRMNFTPEQRLNTLLAATEDVEPEDKIILFQTVYHGSPHKFENFSTENIGTGEGAQAFGWGLYFTNQESIARFYADKLANEPKRISLIAKNEYLKSRKKSLKDVENKEKYEARIIKNINHFKKELKQAQKAGDESEIKFYEGLIDDSYKQLDDKERLSLIESFKKDIANAEQEIKELKASMKNNRNLYTVEIPDEGYIVWDKNISKETVKAVYDGLAKMGEDIKYAPVFDTETTGEDLYGRLSRFFNSDKKASLFLKELGFIGIEYPAHSLSGYTSQDERNYVIFDDTDAKIINHLLFQTNAELMDEARGFDSWQDFMEYCETFHADDEVSPIPSDADAQWYQTFYETSNGVKTEQEKNEEAVDAKNKKDGALPTAVDALFTTMIRSDPQMVDDFLQAVANIDAIDLDSDEWQQAESAEDAKQREQIEKLKDFIGITLSDYNWQTALKRIQGGHEISEGLRKRLIGEMTDSFKARDFRALYAEVMNDEQYAVAEEDSITASLNKKLKKYHDIVRPNDDISRWSPEKRKQLAEQLANREIAAKIRSGSLKLDDELDAYIKSLTKQIKEKQKQFDELEAETKADYQRIADKERRDLLKLHEQLLLARGKLKTRNQEIERKIKKGLKITEKYRALTQNLNANYDEIFRKYSDLRNTITISAEVQAALDRQEQVAGLREDLNAKQKEKNLTAEVKKMRIQLVKRAMRRVPFNRVDFNNARTVIAIQRMLEPNLLGGVNRFIGIDSPYLRGVISQIVTDSDYKEKIMNYLSKNTKASQAFADFKKKLTELKSIKDFDSWTAKDRKAAIRYLPKENWVRDLNLKELAKEREESIDLDIGMEEVKRTVYDEKTGEPKTYKDKDGNEQNVTETAFRLHYDEAIGRLVQDAVGADMFDKIVNMPFSEWTTEDLEGLAQRIDEIYTEGRDLKAAKDEARKNEAAAIRKRIEDAIKETGITINDDDTPEEKERKQKQIEKILGMTDDLKGTEAGKPKGLKARLNRLLHSYSDMNVLRFARMLDGQSEGENVRMLYRKEDDCYNAKQRSMNARAEKIYKVMQDNGITEGDLAETVEFNTIGSKTEFTVDELLYFLAADKDYAEDEKLLAKGETGLDANDDYAATSRNAVMFGNMMSDMISQEEKESWLQLDKDMEEALQNDTLSQEQKEQLATGQLDKKPGTTRYIAACHAKWNAILGLANNYLREHPEYKALMEAIEEDYAEQYGRMNEVSINEFNMPVHRVKAYVPLVRRESNGDTNENQVKEDLLGAAGVGKQWADRGMTQRRVNISPLNQKPVQTGLFRTWADSIERTEHFIAYASYVRQLNAVYKSRDAAYTRRFIESRYGNGALKYLDEYINEVANPNAGRIRERGAEWLHVLRGKTAPAYLGWKASAIIKQGLTSPWPYMQFVNPAEYVAAAMKFTFNPEMREAIKDKSVFMKMRRMDPVNDLIDEMADNAKTKLDRGWSNFSKLGMQGLELIDWACVAPGWLACYEKKYNQLQNASNARYEAKMAELKERNMYADVGTSEYLTPQQMEAEAKKEMLEDIEAEAVRYADDCTRACQPSNRVTDLAPLFKNSSEAMKAFLQFQTSLNVIWQNLRYDMPYAVKNKEFTRIAGTVIGYVCAGIFMNSVMEGIGGDDDDDETQTLRNLIYYSTTQFTDSIPIMGSEITNTMDQLITGKRGFYGSGTDMTPSATKLLSVLTTAKKGNWQKAAELTAEGIGLYLGAPVSGAKEINKLLGKPLSEGDVNLKRGISDVYGIAGDILEE